MSSDLSKHPAHVIQREAVDAAQRYDCINAACPYPFHHPAGRLFKLFFTTERERLQARAGTHSTATHSTRTHTS